MSFSDRDKWERPRDAIYLGWFNELFDGYILYPNLNVLRQEIREVLYREKLIWKLIPIFAKEVRFTNIINNLAKSLGIDLAGLVNPSDSPGLVEQLAKVLLEEVEARKTLEGRIRDFESSLDRSGMYFFGLTHSIFNHQYKGEQKPVFEKRPATAEGSLIAVEGILNHVEAASALNPALAAFKGSEIDWILSDFPYFSMVSENPLYDGNVLGVVVDKNLQPLLERAVPFKRDIGWYPYVVAFGHFRSALSPQYPFIRVVEWSWMRLRMPKPPDAVASNLVNEARYIAGKEKSYIDLLAKVQSFSGPESELSALDRAMKHATTIQAEQANAMRESDNVLFLFLAAIQIIYASQGLDYSAVRPDIREAAEQIRDILNQRQRPLPREIGNFFS